MKYHYEKRGCMWYIYVLKKRRKGGRYIILEKRNIYEGC
jgi:hypothetical protein